MLLRRDRYESYMTSNSSGDENSFLVNGVTTNATIANPNYYEHGDSEVWAEREWQLELDHARFVQALEQCQAEMETAIAELSQSPEAAESQPPRDDALMRSIADRLEWPLENVERHAYRYFTLLLQEDSEQQVPSTTRTSGHSENGNGVQATANGENGATNGSSATTRRSAPSSSSSTRE